MKTKKNKEKYSKKTDKKPIRNKKTVEWKWIFTITIISFLVSFGFSLLSEIIIPNVNIFIGVIVVLLVVLVGVLFDIIGISVTVADPSTFHSMATKKVRGSKLAVRMIVNAEKVSSFCNDVIGDICGIISGSTGAAIAILISNKFNINVVLTTLITMAVIAALTIGGKALGKSFAMNRSNVILYTFCKVVSLVYKA